MKYLYQAVSGSAIWGRPTSIRRARATALKLAANPAYQLMGPFEVERILELPGGGRRYWRTAGKKWVTSWHLSASERKPAWAASIKVKP